MSGHTISHQKIGLCGGEGAGMHLMNSCKPQIYCDKKLDKNGFHIEKLSMFFMSIFMSSQTISVRQTMGHKHYAHSGATLLPAEHSLQESASLRCRVSASCLVQVTKNHTSAN